MTNDEEDLQATIDTIAADARRLRRIEEHKRALDPGDPALVDLAAEALEIAADLPAKAEAQSMLIDRLAESETVESEATEGETAGA